MNRFLATLAFFGVLSSFAGAEAAGRILWDFPRLGNCHEGLAFADGVTGVLVWGGGDELRLTVGRADLWDHRGGYPWTDAQSYTNIVALWRAGEKERLLSLFRKETPAGEPRFFRGCPESWKDVSFENVALSDGRRASGRRRDGVVSIFQKEK